MRLFPTVSWPEAPIGWTRIAVAGENFMRGPRIALLENMATGTLRVIVADFDGEIASHFDVSSDELERWLDSLDQFMSSHAPCSDLGRQAKSLARWHDPFLENSNPIHVDHGRGLMPEMSLRKLRFDGSTYLSLGKQGCITLGELDAFLQDVRGMKNRLAKSSSL
jgi:hypothetical protein